MAVWILVLVAGVGLMAASTVLLSRASPAQRIRAGSGEPRLTRISTVLGWVGIVAVILAMGRLWAGPLGWWAPVLALAVIVPARWIPVVVHHRAVATRKRAPVG